MSEEKYFSLYKKVGRNYLTEDDLINSIKEGNISEVLLILEWTCSYHIGLLAACEYGNLEIAEIMLCGLKKNYDFIECFYILGLERACEFGHTKLVKLMLSLVDRNRYQGPFYNACQNGNKEIIELLIDCGANYWNYGYRAARKCGKREIADLMISYGATESINNEIPFRKKELNREKLMNFYNISLSNDVKSVIYKFLKI